MDTKKIALTNLLLSLCISSAEAESASDSTAAILGLSAPIKIELNVMYTDGGTVGGTITDSEPKQHMFSYDGRQTFETWLPWHKYHVYLNAHHPSHDGAVKLQVCSNKEMALFTLVANWIDQEYPSNWRDPQTWANAGYIARYIDDMENRKCKSKK